MSDPIPSVVRLRSPFNAETVVMPFLPGVPPTLETMLLAGFEVIEEEPVRVKVQRRKDERAPAE